MCQFSTDQPVNLLGRIFCKECLQICNATGVKLHAKFIGHDSGYDVFNLDVPLVCPWCSASNPSFEKPCDDPIMLVIEESREEVCREDRS